MERNWLFQLSDKNEIAKVLEINAYTSKFNLTLSEKDVEILVQERRDTLKQQRRVEFGEGILKKLITTFCDSSYIYQGNYVETIGRLQEILINCSGRQTLQKRTEQALQILIEKEYNNNLELLQYLSSDTNDFIIELKNGAEHQCLEKVVVL